MTRPEDIQGNSWTDEPELPNTKREGNDPKKNDVAKPTQEPQDQGPSSEQRPPADS